MIYRRSGETWPRLHSYVWGGEAWYENKAEGEAHRCIFSSPPAPLLVQTL